MLVRVDENLLLGFLNRLGGETMPLSADLQAALLQDFGPAGRYPDELLPVLRQAALGNAKAVEDLLLLPDGSALVDFLQSSQGQASRLAAEAELDAARPAPEPPQPMREEPPALLAGDAAAAAPDALPPAAVPDHMAEPGLPATDAASGGTVRALLGELYDGLAALLTGTTPAAAEPPELTVTPVGDLVPEAAVPALLPPDRLCWTPLLNHTRPPGALESRYGGDAAWMAADDAWPLHHDGGPMSLVLQFDMATLPGDIAARLGGGPGQLFQLFVPLGMLRGYMADASGEMAFVARLPSLLAEGHIERQPAWDGLQGGIPTLPPVAVEGWVGHEDWPFQHGGPYLPGVEAALAARNGEAPNCRDDKLGGWPSLEGGPLLPEDWDHIIQITGGGATGQEVAFDGHGWLVRDPEGKLHWLASSS